MLVQARAAGLLVPGIWHVEMANILGLKLRDGNLSTVDLEQALRLLGTLDVETRWQGEDDTIQATLDSIARHRLTAYDAIYVDLALQSGCSLLTYDRAMIASARRAGIVVITES